MSLAYFNVGIPGIMSIPMRVGLSMPGPPDLVAPVLSYKRERGENLRIYNSLGFTRVSGGIQRKKTKKVLNI